jgi:hypothetical protein
MLTETLAKKSKRNLVELFIKFFFSHSLAIKHAYLIKCNYNKNFSFFYKKFRRHMTCDSIIAFIEH